MSEERLRGERDRSIRTASRLAMDVAERDSLIVEYKAEIARLTAALREISEGKGRFSMYQFQHAQNTIEDVKELARAALEGHTELPAQEAWGKRRPGE